MRRYALFIPAVLLFAAGLFAAPAAQSRKIHGFVTAVHSPTSFDIDEYKITRDAATAFDFQQFKSVPAVGIIAATFKPEDIRVGTELEVEGDYDDSTKGLKAKSVRVFLLDTVVVDRTAQLEKMPELAKNAAGAWHGLIFADGQCVVVSESTPITVAAKLNEVQPAAAARAAQAKAFSKSGKTKKPDPKNPEPVPFTSPDQISADTFVHYEGSIQPDGTVLAAKIEFEQAGLEPAEVKLWNRMKLKVIQNHTSASNLGQIRIATRQFKLFPDKDVQDYVSNLAVSLIPDGQRNLPLGDPLKIDFRIFVIADDTADCIGYPNGVIIVRSGLLGSVQNEAQLAYILSAEIAGISEKAAWRDLQFHAGAIKAIRGASTAAEFAPFFTGVPAQMALMEHTKKILSDDYAQTLINQADRVGLEIMLGRGYDIRQAPDAWTAMSRRFGDHQEDWKPSDLDRRRSYLQAQLEIAYAQFNYSGLRQNTPDFDRVSQRLAVSAKPHK